MTHLQLIVYSKRMCEAKMWTKLILISFFGCSSILTTSFDLGGVISGNRMAGVPLGRSLGDGEVDIEGICTESGLACQNCTHAVTCIPLPVGWLKVPLQKCPGDETCNARAGCCSSTPVPECELATQKYQHMCEQVGIFPDAFDCRKFHLCSPPEGSPSGSPADHRVGMCPRNYGYNPTNAQCSIKLNKGQCSVKPVPDCTKVGDFGVLPTSPNHYYVCLSKHGAIYPQIFICPHGWFFWDGFCRPESQDERYPETTTKLNRTIPYTDSTIEPTTLTLNVTESTTKTLTTEKTTDTFFSTDKASTVKPDTFLADRFDMSSYDHSIDTLFDRQLASSDEEFVNSWERYD